MDCQRLGQVFTILGHCVNFEQVIYFSFWIWLVWGAGVRRVVLMCGLHTALTLLLSKPAPPDLHVPLYPCVSVFVSCTHVCLTCLAVPLH